MAVLGQGAQDLLGEEGVAAGPLVQEASQVGHGGGLVHPLSDHGGRLVEPQRPEVEAAGGAGEKGGEGVTGPAGGQHEEAAGWRLGHEVGEGGQGSVVYGVEVVHGQDEEVGGPVDPSRDQAAECGPHASPGGVRIDRRRLTLGGQQAEHGAWVTEAEVGRSRGVQVRQGRRDRLRLVAGAGAQQGASELGHGPHGPGRPNLIAGRGDDLGPPGLELGDDLPHQAALAEARWRGQRHGRGPAGPGVGRRRAQERQFGAPAHEGTRRGRGRSELGGGRTHEAVDQDGIGDALHLAGPDVVEDEVGPDQLGGGRGQVDLADFRHLFHPSRDVHGQTLRGVVDAGVVADPADDHMARVQPDPDPEVGADGGRQVGGDGLHLLGESERGPASLLGVTLVGDGGAEQGHHAVAAVGGDDPGVLVDGGDGGGVEALESEEPVLRVESGRDLGRALDVGEQDGDELALAR